MPQSAAQSLFWIGGEFREATFRAERSSKYILLSHFEICSSPVFGARNQQHRYREMGRVLPSREACWLDLPWSECRLVNKVLCKTAMSCRQGLAANKLPIVQSPPSRGLRYQSFPRRFLQCQHDREAPSRQAPKSAEGNQDRKRTRLNS